jgi:RNA polymerase sigma-70 factor (ECF subfamily)
MKLEIETLLLQVKNGNASAMNTLYEQTRRGVFAFILPYVNDAYLTEDIMQETYLKVWQHIDQYAANDRGINWILTIARNTALNVLQIRQKEMQIDPDTIAQTAPATFDTYALNSPLVSLAKQTLTADEQTILFLHAISEYKHREIALILNLPLGTVTWKYNQAIKKMKEALDRE